VLESDDSSWWPDLDGSEDEPEPWLHDWAAALSNAMDLAWLGPFIETVDGAPPLFVGTAYYEYEDRPWLLWAQGDRLFAENLNPEESGS
jgi:hypothetical protein